jgi:hypothetical protein
MDSKQEEKEKMDTHSIQRRLCEELGVIPQIVLQGETIAISKNMYDPVYPVNGMRIVSDGDFSGWFFWAGEEMSDDPSFFKPIHMEHSFAIEIRILKYLGLPPGYRVLFDAEDYEDIWFDSDLLSSKKNN